MTIVIVANEDFENKKNRLFNKRDFVNNLYKYILWAKFSL